MSIGPEDFEAQDRLDDEQEQEDPHCEYCGMNLEVHPCICGPAGPRVGGVWTGGNARYNEVAAADMGAELPRDIDGGKKSGT